MQKEVYTAAENFVKSFELRIKDICDAFKYRNTHKNFRETSLKKHPTILSIKLIKVKKW